MATQLGLAPKKLYGEYDEGFGNSKMWASPELAEALAAERVDNFSAYREATERLVRTFPDEPDAWNHRIVALSNGNSPEEIPARRKEVEACLATLARLDPDSPRFELQRAYLRAEWDEDYRGAIDGYTRVLRRSDLTPRLRSVLLGLRGTAEAQVGDSQAAMADVRDSVRLDPSYFRVYGSAARVSVLVGRFDEAIPFAQQLINLHPEPKVQNALGVYLIYAGKIEESLGPFSKGCDDHSPPANCRNYGWALSLSGHHPEALSLLSPLCGSQPGACLTYATALLRAGKPNEAAEALKKTSGLPEKDTVYGLARYQAVAGNKAEALRLMRRGRDIGVLRMQFRYSPDLKSLRGDPEFQRIMAGIRKFR